MMETRWVQVRPTGPVHKVYVEDGRRYTTEQCNLDDAHPSDLLTEQPEGRGCKHCNPDGVNVAPPPMDKFTQLPT